MSIRERVAPSQVSATLMGYVALTKPRVIELLLVAAIPALLQADRGSIHLSLVLLTLVGGWMGAASANSRGGAHWTCATTWPRT